MEAVQPAAEVAGAVGVDRVGRRRRSHRSRTTSAMSSGSTGVRHEVGLVVGVRGRASTSPSGSVGGAASVSSAGAAHAIDALQQQVGGVDAAELLGAGVDVDQLLRRPRRLAAACSRRSSSRRGARRSRAIRSASRTRCGELRIDADADVAGVQRMAVVEGVLEAEGAADRQLPVLGEALQRRARLRRPAAAAGDDERPLGREQQLAQLAQRARAPARRAPARRAAAPARRSARVSMSSGSTSTTGPGPALHRVWKARATYSGRRSASCTSPTHLAKPSVPGPNICR